MDSKFIKNINVFFDNNQIKKSLTLSFVREDGIILYSSFPNEIEAKSIGALVGGVWQAARSLASFASDQDVIDFRLSFDTSSDGVAIYPIEHDDQYYFLCGIYKDELNPAVTKQKLRILQGKLSEYLSENLEQSSVERDGFLFDEISDEEMDSLFTVTGN